jgi:hypothetical protein
MTLESILKSISGTQSVSWNDVAQCSSLNRVYGHKCALCGDSYNLERHHWLIKRGQLPRKLFPLIDIIVNVVWLCHNCHSNSGNTSATRKTLAGYVANVFGEECVVEWYNEIASKTQLHRVTKFEDI